MDDIPPPEAFDPQPVETGRRGVRRWAMAAVALFVIVALVVLAFVGSGGVAVRDLTGSNDGDVARLVAVDRDGHLSVVSAAGGAATSYGGQDVRFSFPTWSPDGAHVAAIGQGPNGTGVYVFAPGAEGEPDGESVIPYSSPDRPPFYLYWTPDGRQVSFLTTEPDGLALRVAPIDVRSSPGGASASVVRRGAPMYWDFIDPMHLLVNSGTGGPDAFFGEVGLDGTPARGTGQATGIFRAPAVSGDGQFRGYLAAGDAPVGEVVREARDGSAATRIRVFGPAALSFSPTGSALAFVAPDRLTGSPLPLPVGPLRVLDPAAAEPRTLLDGTVVAFFWSPTGTSIAVLDLPEPDDTNVTQASVERPADVADATLARTASRDLMKPGGVRPAAVGIALRLTFVDVVDHSVTPERVVHVSDLFVNQVLPYFDQYALSHRLWSPDGRAIVLPIVGDSDVTQLVAIPADGSEPTVIAIGEFGSWSP